jgi:hypothetical protein
MSYPYTNHHELLRQAKARSEELRDSWRSANYRPTNVDGGRETVGTGLANPVRSVAGRLMIRLGERLLPTRPEPCV